MGFVAIGTGTMNWKQWRVYLGLNYLKVTNSVLRIWRFGVVDPNSQCEPCALLEPYRAIHRFESVKNPIKPLNVLFLSLIRLKNPKSPINTGTTSGAGSSQNVLYLPTPD